ncbi:thiamine pyrophosphate-dependent enzyme [Mycolicibacterium porcinum]|uniref:2-oxoisovalerate dehydrogenase subunit alpha n=1 Tax=Mycolicibacterium porcinum TaxID=39693 RepID=A0AAW5TC70_9MYCO|nr:thiamine pyrophosphate-dependent enzyme [Mycolicibacterium porcinum]MCV7392193.1 pyruvate dehydrogenase (acetyl-transferring) E1 component subunit alpha [Mycolicibacterium porcinum]ORB33938.1 pyruvate dehydrogenase (acetyl-transferring) E1 component subunit alpha [Mycolicibacterium porcinum]CDO29039.1 pyruvate dehydrogenase E1 component subunit alpha [Mycolicibacterium vulneris]
MSAAPNTAVSEPWSVLTPEGVPATLATDEFNPGNLDLRAALRNMILARRIDTEAIALQRQGELGLWPSLLGQEAAQVGAASAVRPQDVVFPTYREHAVAWCRGVDPVSLLGVFRGTTCGGWDPAERGFQLYTVVIAAQTLHGVGYAMGLLRDGSVGTGDPDRDRAVLVFLGDGALSEGETNEAFVWAATQDLPVVFFCQNNQWAISAPYSVQSRIPAADRARGFGFPGVRVDGNDVVACHSATVRALTHAREGGGPTLIEAVTYRRNPHTTSDDDLRYRSSAENDHWLARDPIERLRLYLQSEAAGEDRIDEDFLSEIEEEAGQLADRLRAGCRALPEPDPGEPFRHTLAEMTPELDSQLVAHLEFVSRGSEESR